MTGDIGLPLVRTAVDGSFAYMPTFARLASDYLAAALPLGLQVRRCEEPRRPSPLVDEDGVPYYDGEAPPDHDREGPPNIWALHRYATAATNAAHRGAPIAIVWQLPARGAPVRRRGAPLGWGSRGAWRSLISALVWGASARLPADQGSPAPTSCPR